MEINTEIRYLLIAVVLAFLNHDCAQTATTVTNTRTPSTEATPQTAAVTTTAIPHNCTDNLTNIVVYEGSPASFQRVNNNQSVQWQVSASSDFYGAFKNITNYDDNVTAPFASAYAVNQTQLTIFNSTVVPQQNMSYSTAGLYILRYRDPVCNYAANLIVIRSGPVCSCNVSDPNNVQLICSVDFARAYNQPNPPIFSWKNGTSIAKQQTPVVSSVSSNVKRATSNLQITSNDPTMYECQLTFGSPPKSPQNYITTTAPNFTASCSISNCALTTTVGTATTTQPTTALTTTVIPHNCTDNLTNIVVYEGSPASFQRVNNNQSVQWQVVESSDFYGDFKNITNYDDNVTAPFASAYAVNQTQLIIFNSTAVPQQNMNYSTAGLYILRYRDPVCKYAANLIVIRSGPVCSCNASDPSNVQLFCSVDFARAFTQPNPPVFTWNNGTSNVKQETPLVSSVNFTVKRATSNLPITSNDPTQYGCQLTFGSPPKSPLNYITTTAPNFTASCSISNCALTTTVGTATTSSYPSTNLPETTTTQVSTVETTTAIPHNCTDNLTNIVVYEGSPASFQRLNNNQSVRWLVIPSSDLYGATKAITNYDDNVTALFASAYAVNQTELTIFNSTVVPQQNMNYSTAGLYYLKYRDPVCNYAANLIVIRSGPVCVCNASDPSNVQLSCSVDFARAFTQPNPPVFTWKNGTSNVKQETPVVSTVNGYVKRATSNLQITSNDPTTHECQLTFGSPPKSPLNYITTTAPNFTASCSISNCALTTTVGTAITTQPTTTTVAPTTAVTTAAIPHNCTDNLTNIVVYEGSPASFQRVNNQQSVQWQVSASSDFYGAFRNITNYDDNLTAPFASAYAVNQTQLTIFNSTVVPQQNMNYSTAGLYILRYRDPVCNYAANLIVIRSGPVCSCNASNASTVQLRCSVDFARAYNQPNPPTFTWKNGTSTVKQETPLVSSVTIYVRRATSNLQIASNDPTAYECLLTFGSPPKSPMNYITTTAPNFTASCSVSNCALANGQNGQPIVLGASLDETTGSVGPDGTKIVVGLVVACVLIALIVFGIWFYRFRVSNAGPKGTW